MPEIIVNIFTFCCGMIVMAGLSKLSGYLRKQDQRGQFANIEMSVQQLEKTAEEKAAEIILAAEQQAQSIIAQAHKNTERLKQEIREEGKRLDAWQRSLQKASDKLCNMKNVFQAAEKKAGKTLRIIEARSPHLQRHCRYLTNKIHEMAVAYDRAISAFGNKNEI